MVSHLREKFKYVAINGRCIYCEVERGIASKFTDSDFNYDS